MKQIDVKDYIYYQLSQKITNSILLITRSCFFPNAVMGQCEINDIRCGFINIQSGIFIGRVHQSGAMILFTPFGYFQICSQSIGKFEEHIINSFSAKIAYRDKIQTIYALKKIGDTFLPDPRSLKNQYIPSEEEQKEIKNHWNKWAEEYKNENPK